MFHLISLQFPGFVCDDGGFFIVTGILFLALGGFITFKGYVALWRDDTWTAGASQQN